MRSKMFDAVVSVVVVAEVVMLAICTYVMFVVLFW